MTVRTILALTVCLAAWAVADPPGGGEAGRQAWLTAHGPAPIRVKGRAGILPYEQIDRQLARYRQWLADRPATAEPADLRFQDLFHPSRESAWLPLTNSLLRQLSGAALDGVEVHDQSGRPLGRFAGTYLYTHAGERTFQLTCFQYTTPSGQVRRSGSDLLLDRFLVRWADVRDLPLSGPPEPVP